MNASARYSRSSTISNRLNRTLCVGNTITLCDVSCSNKVPWSACAELQLQSGVWVVWGHAVLCRWQLAHLAYTCAHQLAPGDPGIEVRQHLAESPHMTEAPEVLLLFIMPVTCRSVHWCFAYNMAASAPRACNAHVSDPVGERHGDNPQLCMAV